MLLGDGDEDPLSFFSSSFSSFCTASDCIGCGCCGGDGEGGDGEGVGVVCLLGSSRPFDWLVLIRSGTKGVMVPVVESGRR